NSSASTTYKSRPPTRALPPHPATRPPASPVGSRPAAANASVTITVVVVFPCVPATATTVPPATAWLRASARRTTGTPRARARSSSGWSPGTAAVTTTARAPTTCPGSCPRHIPTPRAAKSAAPEGSLSQPVIVTPCCLARSARPLMPAPAIPMKWIGRGARERDEDARLAPRAQLGHGHRAGARHHDVRGAVREGHGIEEPPNHHAARRGVASQRVRVLQTGAPHDVHRVQQAALERARHGIVDGPGSLAAAEHQEGRTLGAQTQLRQGGGARARLGPTHRIAEC